MEQCIIRMIENIRFKSVMKIGCLLVLLARMATPDLLSQEPFFTRQDTLRGSITPERAWWDLTYYHLSVEAKPGDSSLEGSVAVHYRVLSPARVMQIDLQPPMRITGVDQDEKPVPFRSDGNVYYLELPGEQLQGDIKSVKIRFGGRPKVSVHPPWDGGLVWRTDDRGNPFVATACQGAGASLWWPCKDHMYDEPDSMLISITSPENLTAVGNGRLLGIDRHKKEKKRTFHWFVSNPINNYGVNLNMADYVHFSEQYAGEGGMLDCDYYVLPDNLEKAREQFKDVPRMLGAFEYWFGPYPFYEDGYKLVEVPYPGMEHQSSVTYGNLYQNGFLLQDISHTGWGHRFDFIIVHESGHEWFANSITYRDAADMWIHESFTAYSESLFTEYHFGKEAGYAYVRGTRANISNNRPIIGHYDVNNEGSGDMYPKGANMLHTLRQIVDNDSVWRAMLRGMNREFNHQTVTTVQVESFVANFTGLDLTAFFDQYLRDVRIPVLEYVVSEGFLKFRWNNCVDHFDMPVRVWLDDESVWLDPASRWKSVKLEIPVRDIRVDENFYVATLPLQPPVKDRSAE